ncbi:MAG: hypothetical protein QNK37_30155 [Acidobacteriota bacterium]|nr:hypothetical protein [Acidobacteriota bacterium]
MSEKTMSNNVNVNLPPDLTLLLQDEMKESQMNKKEIISQALRQYLNLKAKEREIRRENPDARLSQTLTFKAYNGKTYRDMASVMIY